MSRGRQPILVWVALVAGLGVLVVYGLLPLWGRATALEQAGQTAQSDYAQGELALTQLPKLRRESAWWQTQVAQANISQKLPIQAVLDSLSQVAKVSHATVVSVTVGTDRPGPAYQETPFTLVISGTVPQLEIFLADLRLKQAYAGVDGVSLESGDAEVTLNLVWWVPSRRGAGPEASSAGSPGLPGRLPGPSNVP